MTMLARIDLAPGKSNRRKAQRRRLMLQRPGIVGEVPGTDVLIHDLSLSGLLIETSAELFEGMTLEVELPEAGWMQAEVVWAQGRFYGGRFNVALPASALSASQLMSPPPSAAPAPFTLASPRTAPANDAEPLPLPLRLRAISALALGAWALVLVPIAAATSLLG